MKGRGSPVSSKILQKKWRMIDYETHQKRLKQVKSSVDIAAPKTLTLQHLQSKAKKDQLKEGKSQRAN